MNEPWFWRSSSFTAKAVRAALFPAAMLYGAGQAAHRRFSSPVDPGVPVVCVGNASVGGSGKTPFCLLLQDLLAKAGIGSAFLTRGYRGALKGPVLASSAHHVGEVGDEALLLAAAAPTWVAKDRAAGAIAAAASGAQLLIMDDGFQNPRLKKSASFLLVNGDEGSLALFPAGPMRERLGQALERADAVVMDAEAPPPRSLAIPLFRTTSRIVIACAPQPVVAFCGIARPERFFAALQRSGFTLRSEFVFPDHHAFDADDLRMLRSRAEEESAILVTTEKDLVRLAPADREAIVAARLRVSVDDPAALVRFVRERARA